MFVPSNVTAVGRQPPVFGIAAYNRTGAGQQLGQDGSLNK
jgi:hypothetical protein